MKSRIPRTLTAVALGVAATLAVAQPTGAARPAAATAAVGPYVKVGYFTQWGIYRRNFLVKNLHTSGIAGKVTHINYAFGNVGVDGRCFEANESGQGDAWADYQKRFRASESVDGVADVVSQPLAGNFNQLRKLKAMYPGLQVQMSLGGWTWSKYFSDAALTPASRQAFVASCIDLFIKGNLPIIGTSPHGGPGSGAGVFDGIEVANAFTYLDFATVQGYDLHGAWEPTTNHQSQLFSPAADPTPARLSVDLAVQSYLAGGAPAVKLVIGIPYYGRGWTGVTNLNNGLYQPASGPARGTYEDGVDDYKKIVGKRGTRFYDSVAGASWLFDGRNFWSYDDTQTIGQKTAYIKANGLGGTMVWSFDGDDASATLTTAIDNGLR